jgi:hypothetical protein
MLRTRSRTEERTFQPVFDFLPPASRAEHLFRIDRELASDEAGLMNQARAALKAYDAAKRLDDHKQCGDLRERLDAIAMRLPLDDEEDDAEERLTRLLAAAPGKVPLWGQKGGFIITCKFRSGVTCRAVIRSSMDGLNASAFDWDGMFLTATGYFELYVNEVRDRSVKQVALAAIRERQNNLRRAEPLVPLVDTVWEADPETGLDQRCEVPGQPDADDQDWQPGGWLYQLKQESSDPDAKRLRLTAEGQAVIDRRDRE